MSLPVKEEVRGQIEFIQKDIVEIVHLAWERWRKLGFVGWSARGRANAVWELMQEEARKRFHSNGLVHIIEEPQTISYLVRDKFLFRFKKGSAGGLSANYPTQMSLNYHDPEVSLPGLPEEPRVEVVYVLDKQLEAKIQDVLVVAREGDNVVWCLSLMDAVDNVTKLPLEGNQLETEERKVKVKAKEVASGGKREGQK